MDEKGYLSYNYANSFKEWGQPLRLEESGGWILKRKIDEYKLYDAMGLYPLFCCKDWTKLSLDFEKLKKDLVSISLVADPFGNYNLTQLYNTFDFVKPFKEHYIADLSCELNKIIARGHKKNSRRALKKIDVEICTNDYIRYLDEVLQLYNVLVKRHKIIGMRQFSKKAFEYQLKTPGMLLVRGLYNGKIVGVNLIIIYEEVAYTHLSAFSDEGYKLNASYAIRMRALEYLKDKVKWVNFGAGAGTIANKNDGLNYFKRGWSTGTRMAYICGKVLNKEKYNTIIRDLKKSNSEYFPQYREGEF
ncbi:hypothetical protein [Clostridium ganghwense]|uniref:GNAT family N-acetyltransferase n=1 Tax=Clostridium ganghwense TaxID=312089 RepID=A0ABT4CQN2_9CLOT|nr:hypothetical protein [Clostridium ganghwense]MCY6370541.1 hypothetical protein [Clostridium ganghwense]